MSGMPSVQLTELCVVLSCFVSSRLVARLKLSDCQVFRTRRPDRPQRSIVRLNSAAHAS